jgi:hypothetical protein
MVDSILSMHPFLLGAILMGVILFIMTIGEWLRKNAMAKVETLRNLNDEINDLRQQRWAQEVNSRIEELMQPIPQPDGADVPWNIALRAAQDIVNGEEPVWLYEFGLSEEDYDKGMNKNG